MESIQLTDGGEQPRNTVRGITKALENVSSVLENIQNVNDDTVEEHSQKAKFEQTTIIIKHTTGKKKRTCCIL